jgi:hypothetical protein
MKYLLKIRYKTILFFLIIILSIPNIIFASESNFTSREDKVAILFGMYDYPNIEYDLTGPPNDVTAMRNMLEEDGYIVYVYENVSEDSAFTAIETQFAGSGEEDTLLVYYSGHGGIVLDESVLWFTNTDSISDMSVSELQASLDIYPSTKVVLLDSCYSGGFVNRDIITEEEIDEVTEEYNQNIIDVFESGDAESSNNSTRYLNSSSYKVITACAGNEYSWEGYLEGAQRGYFTYYYTKGCGYFDSYNILPADDNGDEEITQTEIFNYTYENIISIDFISAGQHYTQTVKAYPYESGDAKFIIYGNIVLPYISNISVDPEVGYTGDTYTTTIETNDNVDKVNFYTEGNTYHSQVDSTSSGVTVKDNGDGTSTWEISRVIGQTGERTFSYKVHNENGWSTEYTPVSFTVKLYPFPTIDSISVDPEVGYTGDTYTTTIETNDNVDKVNFYTEGNVYHSQVNSSSRGVTVTNNGDGTSTWEISWVIGQTGERTFSYKVHNFRGWSTEYTPVSFMVN